MRRLFSTFARGWPGAGLLLLRLVAGIALIVHGISSLRGGPAIGAAIMHGAAISGGVLLLAGLWTPIAGVLIAVVELWSVFWELGDPWIHILLGVLGAALSLLGPGGWSIDARLFGWKRLEIRDRMRQGPPPFE